MHDPAALRVAPRQLLSPLAITVALLAALVLTMLPAGSAIAATPVMPKGTQSVSIEKPAKPAQPTGPMESKGPTPRAAAPKAVIIVGPVEGLTDMYLGYGKLWADRAAAQGMDVRRIFSPYATWSAVLANIQDAKLVVYLGHGNGWPSPYGPFQENTKNGFGLNSTSGAGHNNVKYYGATMMRESIRLATNAIVVLGHACYSPGTGETWQAEPTATVAKERVDNFASGFLAIGARTYFAYYFEQTRNMVADLFTTHQTMDELFKMKGGTPTYSGFAGTNHPYYDSVRTPGARIHLDWSNGYGWYRAVAGDLSMTTDEWVGAPAGLDETAPELTRFAPVASAQTFAAAPTTRTTAPAVFTPNGDGVSDTVPVATTVSEGSYVDVVVSNPAQQIVRRFTTWVPEGTGSVTWDGKNAAAAYVPEGDYRLLATPKDPAGNVGDSASALVAARDTVKSAVASPAIFFNRDLDGLMAKSDFAVTLARSAVVTWNLTDLVGNVVAPHLDAVATEAGVHTWSWDGTRPDGTFVPDGVYWNVVTTTSAAGTYTHRFSVSHTAFRLWSAVSSAKPGVSVTFTATTAEPLSANPTITITQPGLVPYKLATTRVDAWRYKVTVKFKAGGAGVTTLKVWGRDTGTQSQASLFKFTVD
jgi:flagellar hook assembly protein FlgD